MFVINRLVQRFLAEKITIFFGRFKIYAFDLIDLATYTALVAYWRFFWDAYDHFIFLGTLKDYVYYIIVFTHVGIYLIYIFITLVDNFCCVTDIKAYDQEKSTEESETMLEHQKYRI
jgi:hypothetical protein